MTHSHSPRSARAPTRGDGRAVSEVIGFILLFGLVIAGASIIQTYGVPAQNERVEFDHNIRVQDDVVRLADDVEAAGLTGAAVSATVEAGTDYPNRLFFFNPAPPSGVLRTGDVLNVTVANATAVGDAGDYWNGTVKTFDTRAVSYTPNYNVYRQAPTTVAEYGVVYNDNPNGHVTVLKRGSFVRGDRISLVTVDGTFNRGSAQAISVDAVPLSAPSQTVTLTSTQNITLAIETSLSAAEWEELLADELASNGGNVLDVREAGGAVTIVLAPNVSYEFRLARVGLESGYDDAASREAYLTVVGDAARSIPEDSTETVTVEVRDAFNNPVSGVTVNVASELGGSLTTPTAAQTDSDGRATFTYTAPSVDGSTVATDRLKVGYGPVSPDDAAFDRNATSGAALELSVTNTDGSGITGGAGTGEGGQSEWSDTETSQQITVANGRWNNISHVESITLRDGEMVTVERCKTGSPSGGGGAGVFTECKFVDTLRLSFSLSNADDAYTVDVNLEDCNQDGDFTDTCTVDKLTFEEDRAVTIYDDSGTVIFDRSLDDAGTQGILSAAGTNLLDAGSYTSGSQTTLNRLKLDDATWLTGLMQGRVTVSISST